MFNSKFNVKLITAYLKILGERMNKDAFVKRSIERHGNKAYSYEAVPDKVNAKDKVSII